MSRRALAAAFLTCVALGGCGGKDTGKTGSAPAAAKRPGGLPLAFAAAARPAAADFPAPHGQTLRQLSKPVRGGLGFAPANSVLTPGRSRVAFALLDPGSRFVYAPTALYIATGPDAPVRGPFLAPADSLAVAPRYRSRTAAQDPDTAKAVYAAQVPFPHAGNWSVLAMARQGNGLVGAAARLTVARSSRIPDVGQRPPRVSTATLADVHGHVGRIDTRVPPDDMHSVDFAKALGRRPIALIMATPALCQSKVCGPVVDVAEQLKATYGDRVAFIHQEVYRDNQVQAGLRPQLQAFHLQSEPWIFMVSRDGRIAARFEGATGVAEMRRGLEAALRG